MALSGLSSLERDAYVSKDDPSHVQDDVEASIANGATVFWLANIPNMVMAKISDNATAQQVSMTDGGMQTFVQKRSEKNREAFRYGVTGWDNFPDKEGNPIEAVYENVLQGGKPLRVLSEASLNKVPLSIINEVGLEVFNRNSMTEPQRKKYAELSSVFGDLDTSLAPTAPKSKKKTVAARSKKQSAGTTGETP